VGRHQLGLALACWILPLSVIDAEAGPRSRPIRTGQTTCYDTTGTLIPCVLTGQDGDLQRGEPRSYADEGNGTLRDKRAGLTWEKLSDDGSIHDKDNQYTWEQAFERIDTLNATSFAGFDDWRVPNAAELMTLLFHGGTEPALAAAFDTGCAPACTVLTCSCKGNASANFWASTTYALSPSGAWVFDFQTGYSYAASKTSFSLNVRAVRGGTVAGGGM